MPFSTKNKCLVALLSILVSCKTGEVAVPEISFQKDTFDFGVIRQGDSAKAIFNFRNDGTGILEIRKVGASCGCTNTVSSKNNLDINESATIFAIYHSGKDSGSILKTIIVETNTNPVLHVLYIKGMVRPLSQYQTRPGS